MRIYNIVDNTERLHIQLRDLKYINDFYKDIPEKYKIIFNKLLFKLEMGYKETDFETFLDRELIMFLLRFNEIVMFNEFYNEPVIESKKYLYDSLVVLVNSVDNLLEGSQEKIAVKRKAYAQLLNSCKDVNDIIFHKCGIHKMIFPDEIYYRSIVFQDELNNTQLPIYETLDPNVWRIIFNENNSIDYVDSMFTACSELMQIMKEHSFYKDNSSRKFYINSIISDNYRYMDIIYELNHPKLSKKK